MSSIPDSNWLNIFKLNASDGVAFTIVGIMGLSLSWLGWLYLDALGDIGRALFSVCAIIGIALLSKHAVEAVGQWRRRKTREAERLRHLDALSVDGQKILSYLVSSNRQHFVAPVDCPKLSPLVRSLLIDQGDGGTPDEKPYFVRHYVWKALRRRRAEFRTEDVNGAPPWSARNERW